MNQTFADRRRMTVTDGVSLKELKTSFPCLFSQAQIQTDVYVQSLGLGHQYVGTGKSEEQESPAVADKPARRLRNVCTVYVRAVGL